MIFIKLTLFIKKNISHGANIFGCQVEISKKKSDFMNQIEKEVTSIFEETNALLKGHFILRSGLRSGRFFQCAQVCQHMDKVSRLAELLLLKVSFENFNTVVSLLPWEDW